MRSPAFAEIRGPPIGEPLTTVEQKFNEFFRCPVAKASGNLKRPPVQTASGSRLTETDLFEKITGRELSRRQLVSFDDPRAAVPSKDGVVVARGPDRLG